MKRNNLTFTTPKSKAVIKSICDRLRQSAATVFDLADAIGKSVHTVKSYLAHLKEVEVVVCVKEAYIRPQQGSAPAVWALNVIDAPRRPVARPGRANILERLVVVRKSGDWEPNHARMALDCYLFGVPAVLQQVSAS